MKRSGKSKLTGKPLSGRGQSPTPMDKNKSAEEMEKHIIASYTGEWVKFEDHQQAVTTLQQAKAELEKQNAELVAALQKIMHNTSGDNDGMCSEMMAELALRSHEANKG